MPAVGWRLPAGVFASALLIAVYARGGPAFALGFVALVPWLRALDGVRGPGSALLAGWLMAVGYVAAGMGWFGAAIGGYTGIGGIAGVALLLLAAPLLQPQLLAFVLVRHWAGRRHGPALRALAGACAWVACEWAWPKMLGDTLGHGLQPAAWLRQLADVGGAPALTLALLLANEAVAAAIARRRQGARAWGFPLLAALAVPVLLAGYGALRLAQLDNAPGGPARTLRVGLVQANIVDYEGLRRQHGSYAVVRNVLDTHFALSRQAVGEHRVDALLWSETVYPTSFGQPRSEAGAAFDQEITGFVRQLRVPLVFGTYDRDAGGEYNAAAFVAPDEGLLGFYRKTHLFPLTERVPGWLDGPALRRLLPWAGTWVPGNGARVLPLRLADGSEVPVGTLICLDDVHPGVARDAARQGAQVLLGLSNDSWFSQGPAGARLHLAAAAFRSIETRLPQLRVTANGFSAVVDASGAIGPRTLRDQRALLVGEVALRAAPPTLAVAWGNWVGPAALVLLLGLATLAWLPSAGALRRGRGAPQQDLARGVEASVLTPATRRLAALLQVAAGVGLAWVGIDLLVGDGDPARTLPRLRLFAAACVAPAIVAWALQRAQAGRVRLVGGALLLEQPARTTRIASEAIDAARAWRVPLPGPGLDLRCAGEARARSVEVGDPWGLLQALATSGAAVGAVALPGGAWARAMQARALRARPALDQAWLKFGVFPLLPALVAFRLHQQIAYGGTFGEALTYGVQAWAVGLLVWWGKWAMGMTVLAGGVRVAIEAVALAAAALRPQSTHADRHALEAVARAVYYLGVPLWLALRLWP
jgi:apolipoprotein N-acyltransferase